MSIPPLPKIPLSRGVSPEVRRALDALSVSAAQIAGRVGEGGSGAETVIHQPGTTTTIDEPAIYIPISEPLDPVGFVAEGLYESVLLRWDRPTYDGHSHTVIRRATADTPRTAVIVGTSETTMFLDKPPIRGATYYYWVTHVNLDGVGDTFDQQAQGSRNSFDERFGSGLGQFANIGSTAASVVNGKLSLSGTTNIVRAATPMSRNFVLSFDYGGADPNDLEYKRLTVTIGQTSALTGTGRYTIIIDNESDGIDDYHVLTITKNGTPLKVNGRGRFIGERTVTIEVNASGVAVRLNGGLWDSAPDISLDNFTHIFFSGAMTTGWGGAASPITIDNVVVTGDQADTGLDPGLPAVTTNDPAVLMDALAGSLGIEQFKLSAGVFPIRMVDALPTLPDAKWPAGSQTLLTTDGKLYRTQTGLANSWKATVSAADLKDITQAQLAAGLEPAAMVNALPAIEGYTGPKLVMLSTDKKLYRLVEVESVLSWSAGFSAAELNGELVATQIATNAVRAHHIEVGAINAQKIALDTITAGKIATGAVTVDKLGAGELLTNEANFGDTVITNAKIESVSADKIIAGTVSAHLVIVGSLLKSADEKFKIETGATRKLTMTGDTPDQRVELTDGDVKFFVPGLPSAYKACRRIVQGQAVDGEYIPFDPPFYTTPKILLGQNSMESTPGHSTVEVSVHANAAAVNVTASGFQVVSKNTHASGRITHPITRHTFPFVEYWGEDPDVSNVQATNGQCWVSPLLQLNVARFAAYFNPPASGHQTIFNTYYRAEGVGPWIKAEDHVILLYGGGVAANTTNGWIYAPVTRNQMFNLNTRYQVMICHLGTTGANAHLNSPTFVNYYTHGAMVYPSLNPISFIAIEGG